MALIRLYKDWEKNLEFWQEKLRHLKWVSEYRIRILSENMDFQGKRILDIGSGPQFTAQILKEKGAFVFTVDKYAPCDCPLDVNSDLCVSLKERDFDLVILGAVIRYVKNKKKFFQQLAELLKPEGIVFIDEFVHNYWNDEFLEYMVSIGAMEQWPKENFVESDKLLKIIEKTKKFSLFRFYSCWPLFYLEGKNPFAVWYSLLLKKR